LELKNKFEQDMNDFENALIRENLELRKKCDEAMYNFQQISESRIWRFSSPYRKLGNSVKELLRKSLLGKWFLTFLRSAFR